MQNIVMLIEQLVSRLVESWKVITEALVAALVLFGLSGCVDPNLPEDQKDAALARNLMVLEKIADLADRQGLSYSAELQVGGKPAVGEELRFFLDTDVSLTVNVHGNSAAGRPADPAASGSGG